MLDASAGFRWAVVYSRVLLSHFHVSSPRLGLLWLKTCYGVCVVADPDLLWGQILEMLNAYMPEELYLWISNLKQTTETLLERALELLQTLP